MPDVRYRTKDGHPSVIRTVEEAIAYIDKNIGKTLADQLAFKAAKDALHKSLEGKVTIGAARETFVNALQVSRLLII
jgi:hypothetical protein